jgi:hypothetical protein
MKTERDKSEQYIDELINREKLTEHNPYLTARIMSRIENPLQKPVNRWQTIAVAASIVFAIVSGIGLGNSYSSTSDNISGLNINDSQIENFSLYNTDSNE